MKINKHTANHRPITNSTTIAISPLFHNCALHMLVPFINVFIHDNPSENPFTFKEATPDQAKKVTFKKTEGYQIFLKAFANYYQLPLNRQLPEKISAFLNKYSHPYDQQVLLGPVLRIVLKEVLLKSKEHKDALKASFVSMVNSCRERYKSSSHPSKVRDKAYKAAWLLQQNFSAQEEHEELFKPNIDIIAELLENTDEEKVKQQWDIAYQHYCDYQCDLNKGVYISENQIALLCQSFQFKFEHVLQDGQINSPLSGSYTPLATVSAQLKNSNHWEINNKNSSNWDYTEKKQAFPAFALYQETAEQYMLYDMSEAQIKLLQKIFQKTICHVFSKNQEFEDTHYTVLPPQHWVEYSGLEGLVHIIVKALKDQRAVFYQKAQNKSSVFLTDSTVFKQFLKKFCQYYEWGEISDKEVFQKIKQMLHYCNDEQQQFMIFSPVLREMAENKFLTLDVLIKLYHAFNIELEFYYSRTATDDPTKIESQVSAFNKKYITPLKEAFATQVMTQDAMLRYHPVIKDALTGQIETIKRNHTKPISLTPAAVKIKVKEFFRSGLLKFEDETVVPIEQAEAFCVEHASKLSSLHTLTIKECDREFTTAISFKKEINEKTRESIRLEHRFIEMCAQWTPLHFAIYFNQPTKARELLKAGADWRIKGVWKLKDPSIVANPSLLAPQVNALELAACLDNVLLATVLLEFAQEGRDDKFVQAAYEQACNFKRAGVLHAFLPYKLNHLPQAIFNAIEAKDYSLLNSLYEKEAPLPWKSEYELLSFSFASFEKEPSFELSHMLLVLTHLRRSKAEQAGGMLAFNQSVLNIISEALDKNKPEWVIKLFSYLEAAPKLLKIEKKLGAVYADNQKMLVEFLAKRACLAITRKNASDLKNCIYINEQCLLVPGRHNPLHHAWQQNLLSFVEDHYVQFYVDRREKSFGQIRNLEEYKTLLRNRFNSFAQSAYDQYDRSLSFRLQRQQTHAELAAQCDGASSWMDSFKLNTKLTMSQLEDVRIIFADRLHEKIKHTSKTQQDNVYKIGQPLLFALRTLGTLSKSPIRYALDLGFYFAPSIVKTPLLWAAEKGASWAAYYANLPTEAAKFYIPYFLDNATYFAFMPQYYIASTLLNNLVYAAFKNHDAPSMEAAFYLLTDGIAHSWAAGIEHNYPIDDRYTYRVNRNIAAILGEGAAAAVTPVVASIDGLGNRLNEFFNLPKKYLTEQGPDQSRLPASLPSLIGLNDQYILPFKEQLFNFVEQWLLTNCFNDSSFKTERLHLFYASKASEEAVKNKELEEKLEENKAQLEKLKNINKNAEAEIAKATKELESIEKELKKAKALLRMDPKPNTVKKINQVVIEPLESKKNKINENISQHKEVIAKNQEEYGRLSEKELSLTAAYEQQSAAYQQAQALENQFFQQLEGFKYFEDWQEKYFALQYEQASKSSSAKKIKECEEAVDAAKKKLDFYNSDFVGQIASVWSEQVDAMFAKHANNFVGTTPLQDVVDGIVDHAFSSFGGDKGAMAEYCANEVIRKKYPLYPDIGNAADIEAERTMIKKNIAENKLQASKERNRKKDVNGFLLAAFSGQPEQKRLSSGCAHEVKVWLAKGVANAVAFYLTGGNAILFPDFFAGPKKGGSGNNFSWQFYTNFGGTQNGFGNDLVINDVRVASYYNNGENQASFALFPDTKLSSHSINRQVAPVLGAETSINFAANALASQVDIAAPQSLSANDAKRDNFVFPDLKMDNLPAAASAPIEEHPASQEGIPPKKRQKKEAKSSSNLSPSKTAKSDAKQAKVKAPAQPAAQRASKKDAKAPPIPLSVGTKPASADNPASLSYGKIAKPSFAQPTNENALVVKPLLFDKKSQKTAFSPAFDASKRVPRVVATKPNGSDLSAKSEVMPMPFAPARKLDTQVPFYEIARDLGISPQAEGLLLEKYQVPKESLYGSLLWGGYLLRALNGDRSPEIIEWQKRNKARLKMPLFRTDQMPEENPALGPMMMGMLKAGGDLLALGVKGATFPHRELIRFICGEETTTEKISKKVANFIELEAGRIHMGQTPETIKKGKDFINYVGEGKFIQALENKANEFELLPREEKLQIIGSELFNWVLLPGAVGAASKVATTATRAVVAAEKGGKAVGVAAHGGGAVASEIGVFSETAIARRVTQLAKTKESLPAVVKSKDIPQNAGFTPRYDLRSTERFEISVASVPKNEAKALLRSGELNIPEVQAKKLLKILNTSGQIDKVTLKKTGSGLVRLAAERPGKASGYQRMSYEVDLLGNRKKVVQTAFDNNDKLVHQKPGQSKNNLYDVKKWKNKH